MRNLLVTVTLLVFGGIAWAADVAPSAPPQSCRLCVATCQTPQAGCCAVGSIKSNPSCTHWSCIDSVTGAKLSGKCPKS